MKRISLLFSFFLLGVFTSSLFGQINARLLQHPDISDTHITFVYGGDIWIVSKDGGVANRISSPSGVESFPKFSPDGSLISFSANYDGNSDLYVIPAMGGVAERVTYHSYNERNLDWCPDGKGLLYASSMYSGRQRYRQFYRIEKDGGLPMQLPIPYGEFASVSEDRTQIAYTKRTRVFRTWKRYRGGTAADIFLFNPKTFESENITNNEANDEIPMFHGKKVYFISDRDGNKRFNVFVYDTESKKTKQLTNFKDFDVHFPSIGPKDMVFEAGGKLYVMDLTTEKYKSVDVKIVGDFATLKPQNKNVRRWFTTADISPDGKRVVVEARGEIFSLPAEHGFIKNLTKTSGVAERSPSWSPNGKYIAYWSDKNGEYQLTVYDNETGKEKSLTNFNDSYRYDIFWAPNSKKLSFIDVEMKIHVYDFDKDKVSYVDQAFYKMHGALAGFRMNWSSDSRYVTYATDFDNRQQVVKIYDTKNDKLHQVTAGYYSTNNPVFDKDGKYLFVTTNREFRPSYSDFGNNWIYANSTQLAAIPLTKKDKSPIAQRNDEVKVKEEKKEEEKNDKKNGKKEDKKKDEVKEVKIDFDGFEGRMVVLPVDAGNIGNLSAVKGKILFQKFGNTGSGSRARSLMYYDLEKRKTETIMGDVRGYTVSADEKNILVFAGRDLGIIKVAPKQKLDKKIALDDLKMTIDPMAEWQQMFRDAWRLQRDMFYDKNMHGVDWKSVYDQYSELLKYAVHREDVNFLLGEMIGELNASHAYKGGGDQDYGKRENVGYLGINWGVKDGHYTIKEIIDGAEWDNEVRSPFAESGVEVKAGDFILAVNGVTLDVKKSPYAYFQGLGEKAVELTINSKPSFEGAKTVVVKTLGDESRLRHLAWIEANRKRVEEATDGKVGYIYVRSTGIDGQTELVRQYYAQLHKDALIIDERFNSGGQIPDRFVELLDRKPLAFWAVRDGRTWKWPPAGNFGPKVMLINGWSGSGGDAFPDYFRKYKLGPLVGTRTWGGLIGISGAPQLIDGGVVTVPTFRMYDPNGDWFKEGHGVDPDIKVEDDPTSLAKGVDAQLEAGIEEIKKLLKSNPPVKPKTPVYEKR